MRTTRLISQTLVATLICCTVACVASEGPDGSDDGSSEAGGGAAGGSGSGSGMTSGLETQCGNPGDAGNEKGVGKYCDGLFDCLGEDANLCATLGDPKAHFCTMRCTQGSTDCGADATCSCQGDQCGCTPNACI